MTMRHRDRVLRRLNRPVLIWRITLLATGFLLAITVSGLLGFRVNLTPSEPLGLWRIIPLDRSVMVGDIVFICPPATPIMREARSRGYLRDGLCLSGMAPLIKAVLAVGGQTVDICDDVRIDGEPIANSRVMREDAKGRPLVPYAGGVLPSRTVFVHSAFPGSFDSRYFGPLPLSNVLGLARKVWTYAP